MKYGVFDRYLYQNAASVYVGLGEVIIIPKPGSAEWYFRRRPCSNKYFRAETGSCGHLPAESPPTPTPHPLRATRKPTPAQAAPVHCTPPEPAPSTTTATATATAAVLMAQASSCSNRSADTLLPPSPVAGSCQTQSQPRIKHSHMVLLWFIIKRRIRESAHYTKSVEVSRAHIVGPNMA